MLDVIDLFKEKDTRDELGIGSVRDAFADLLFPGTSTIQTRARYFLFIPWVYLDIEKRRVPSAKAADRARRQEINLIEALLQGDDQDGVIGRLARQRLQRLPSNIYWQGLGALGIRLFPGSQDQYHRGLDGYYALLSRRQRQDDEESLEGRRPVHWHPGLPSAPTDFPAGASLVLTFDEATYLRERILTQAPGTLLAFWADRRPPPLSQFPWELPGAGYSARLQEQLVHAQNFSEAVHGAVILYNLMLAEQAEDKHLTTEYRERMADWAKLLEVRQVAFGEWDQRGFWGIVSAVNPRIPHPTRLFVEQWLELALGPGRAAGLADLAEARQLVHERERFLKRGLARLENRRALDLWHSGGGAAGLGRLDYRWDVAQRHLVDLHAGLARKQR